MMFAASHNALRVYRYPLKIETVDYVKLLSLATSPRTAAVLNAKELGGNDRFDHVLARKSIRSAFQIGLMVKTYRPAATNRLIFIRRWSML